MEHAAGRSAVRARVDSYTTALVLAVSSYVFLTTVKFLPASPLLPALVALGLALAALSRPVWAGGVFALLAFLAIVWQLAGFGLGGLMVSYYGDLAVAFILLFVLLDLAAVRNQPVSMSLALLAVSLMLTPFYYLSVAVMVVAATIGGLKSIGPASSTFLSALLPFVLIENSIVYSGVQQFTSVQPVIFSQYVAVAKNMIPPLGSLNVFLTGLPAGASSPYAGAFVSFVGGGLSSVVLIPLVLLALVFSSSASLAGATSSLVGWATRGRVSERLRAFLPVVGALATPVAFVLLDAFLSAPDIGDYQTGLVANPGDAGLMVAASFLLGGAFTVREFGVLRLERLERMKAMLRAAVAHVARRTSELKGVLARVQSAAPELDVGPMAGRVQEAESKTGDMLKGLGPADAVQTEAWLGEARERILPELEQMPERLRLKVVEEAAALSTLSATYNAILEETPAKGRFPEKQEGAPTAELEEALAAYIRTAAALREGAEALFKEYEDAAAAYNALMGKGLIVPPVDPARVLETRDYSMAMKLVAQDYWVNFQAARLPDLEASLGSLARVLRKAEAHLDPTARERLETSSKALTAPGVTPAAALGLVEGVVTALRSEATRTREEVERLQALSKSLSPEAARVVRFEILRQAGDVTRIEDEAAALKPSVEEVGRFAEEASLVFGAVEEARAKDARSMLLLSQYPVASEMLEAALKGEKGVRLADLPFLAEASSVYARLYTSGKRSLRYDDLNEEVVKKHA